MVYNDLAIIDTRGINNPNASWEEVGFAANLTYSEESGDYSVPAGPGGGGSTPPTLPAGWSVTGAGATPPKTGGTGGGSWQQWVTPETIGATVGAMGSVAGMIGAGRSPDKAKIKAVCGRKPLFNIGGKKDAYNQCVQNLMMPQPVYTPPAQTGMSTGTKVLIGVMAFLVLLAIIITIVMLMKKNQQTATA